MLLSCQREPNVREQLVNNSLARLFENKQMPEVAIMSCRWEMAAFAYISFRLEVIGIFYSSEKLTIHRRGIQINNFVYKLKIQTENIAFHRLWFTS